MLDKVQYELINIINSNGSATSKFLADRLSLSKRSIINHVQKINSEYPGLVIASKQGYHLNAVLYQQLMSSDEVEILAIDSLGYRTNYIISSFLYSYNDSVNILDIGNTLYFSESTVRSEIAKLRSHAKSFGLDIATNFNTVTLNGKESDKRQFFFSFIFGTMDEDINDWSTIAAYFPHIDLDSIKEAITNTIDQNNFSVSDYALSNIVVQIAIALARIKQDHQIDSELYTLFLRDQDFKMAQSVCKAIASINNVVFTKNEITQIALLLAAICDKFNVVATMDNLSDYIWPDLYKLINNIADDLNRYYSIDLRKDSHNFVAFCLHIRCMVHRLTAGIHICNPYLETLKRKHIIVYDTAVYISYKISKHYNIAVNEDEISYLALYIGNVYETFLSSKTKVSALFILPNYHINQGLYLTYAKEFASQMNTYCVSSIDNCKNPEDYDIIISSNNLIYVGSNKAPHITISPLANNRDRSSIQNAIIEVRQKRSIKFIAEVF